MKKLAFIILIFVSVSVSVNAQYSVTAVKKATLLEDGTPIVNGKTGEVLRISKASVNISELNIEALDLSPGKIAPNQDNQINKTSSPKERDKNQLKKDKN